MHQLPSAVGGKAEIVATALSGFSLGALAFISAHLSAFESIAVALSIISSSISLMVWLWKLATRQKPGGK